MTPSSGPSVSLQTAAPRGIAAVRARLPIHRVPANFATYLNQVYDAGRAGLVQLDGQNVFVYRGGLTSNDEDAEVEFGVGVAAPFTASGAVVYSTLPTGEVATATHWGDYSRLGEAHRAVMAWCREHGRTISGTRWEVYGHWSDDPAQLRTDVFHLLLPPA
jgi:effector-binding domain-containing protein